MTKRALLFVNQNARHGQESIEQVRNQLVQLGFKLTHIPTSAFQTLPELIHQYRDQIDLVILGGGDGTLNAVVDTIVHANLPLGIVPLGTANDLARTLNIPESIPEACNVIATGHTQLIDLGRVNGKHFFNVASLGLSTQITKQLTNETKQRWGIFAYAITALQVLWSTRPLNAEIDIDGHSVQVRTVQIAVGNGRYYGGGMAIADDAKIDDQRLDIYSLEIRRGWQIIPLLPVLWSGKLSQSPKVRTMQGHAVRIYTHLPHPISTDGEITTRTPAKFQIVPKALRVFVTPP